MGGAGVAGAGVPGAGVRPAPAATVAVGRGRLGDDPLGERREERQGAERRRRSRFSRRRSGRDEEAEDRGDLVPELGPVDDAIEEPVLEQELRALEPFGQLLGDRPRRHPGAGKADEGVRLRDVDVAE